MLNFIVELMFCYLILDLTSIDWNVYDVNVSHSVGKWAFKWINSKECIYIIKRDRFNLPICYI